MKEGQLEPEVEVIAICRETQYGIDANGLKQGSEISTVRFSGSLKALYRLRDDLTEILSTAEGKAAEYCRVTEVEKKQTAKG